jgi:rare lipoprotein A
MSTYKFSVYCAALLAILAAFLPLKARAAQCGTASWYHEGKLTATGERYRPDGITAAHRTLPFGTIVQVRHQRTGRTVTVRINDRGPFIRGRIIDLSRGAKRLLGMGGLAPVCFRVVGRNQSHARIARADRLKRARFARAERRKQARLVRMERRKAARLARIERRKQARLARAERRRQIRLARAERRKHARLVRIARAKRHARRRYSVRYRYGATQTSTRIHRRRRNVRHVYDRRRRYTRHTFRKRHVALNARAFSWPRTNTFFR